GQRLPFQKVSVSDRGLFMVWAYGKECQPPVCLLRLPHRPGEHWENLSTLADMPFRELAEASGPEPVAMPAGTFRAFRVDSRAGAGFGGSWVRTTAWYAPGVGLVKKVSGGEVSTLQSFTPGGGKAAAENKMLPTVLRSPLRRITLGSEADPVAYGPDGRTLATANRDGSISLRNATTGKERATLRGRAERVRALAHNPDGQSPA